MYFWGGSNGLLKNCSLLGTVSPNNNDIARYDTTANVTFACADGEVGTPVQMSGTEIIVCDGGSTGRLLRPRRRRLLSSNGLGCARL